MQIQAARSPWQIQRSVVFALLLREVKGRFGGRLIGGFWVLFEPLVHLGLMTFFMTTIAGRVLPGVAPRDSAKVSMTQRARGAKGGRTPSTRRRRSATVADRAPVQRQHGPRVA